MDLKLSAVTAVGEFYLVGLKECKGRGERKENYKLLILCDLKYDGTMDRNRKVGNKFGLCGLGYFKF